MLIGLSTLMIDVLLQDINHMLSKIPLLGEVKKKKSMVSRNSVEAELRSTTLGVCEALWLMILQEELGV